MVDGFFTPDDLIQYSAPGCSVCKLFEGCKSPRMGVSGSGDCSILVIAEAPGGQEDEQGTQLIGDSGKLLRHLLGQNGVDLHEDCWKINAVNCRPPDNRTPTEKEIAHCRPMVLSAIQELKPRQILLCGKAAVQSVIGYLRPGNVDGLERWLGCHIPLRKWNCWVTVTYHPSFLLRTNDPVVEKLMREHLALVAATAGRPYETEDERLEDKVRVLFDEREIIAAIQSVIRAGTPAAFDYETEGLKPDNAQLRIVSVAIANEQSCFAFLLKGARVKRAFIEFLTSPLGKIAANLKFEDRWTRAELGVEPVNWIWDTMVAAHVLDNRTGITSLKHQAFVTFGVEDYDSHIHSFLQADGGNAKNQIDRIPVNDLLLYNGMDALLEFMLYKTQYPFARSLS